MDESSFAVDVRAFGLAVVGVGLGEVRHPNRAPT
jgi:hypothetical protein